MGVRKHPIQTNVENEVDIHAISQATNNNPIEDRIYRLAITIRHGIMVLPLDSPGETHPKFT